MARTNTNSEALDDGPSDGRHWDRLLSEAKPMHGSHGPQPSRLRHGEHPDDDDIERVDDASTSLTVPRVSS